MSQARYHEPSEVLPEIGDFLAGSKSLILATRDNGGHTQPSYAPFVSLADNDFHIYISELNKHTENLQAMREASVMVIEDEAQATQIFARKRFIATCRIYLIERDTSAWVAALDAFQARFGDVMELMRPLVDFKLIRLVPVEATFVKGFGQAFQLTHTDLEKLATIRSS